MKKLFVIFCLCIFFCVGLFVVLSGPFIGKGIKQAILFTVPQLTQAEIELEKVHFFLFSGKIGLENLELKNPEGFDEKKAFSVAETEINIDLQSLLTKHIIIERIYILKPDIIYEKTPNNSNIESIVSNIKQGAQARPTAQTPPQSIALPEKDFPRTEFATDQLKASEETNTDSSDSESILTQEKIAEHFSDIKISVKELIIKEATGKINYSKINFPAKLPDIEAHNIGTAEDGLPPEELFAEIVEIIATEISKSSL